MLGFNLVKMAEFTRLPLILSKNKIHRLFFLALKVYKFAHFERPFILGNFCVRNLIFILFVNSRFFSLLRLRELAASGKQRKILSVDI